MEAGILGAKVYQLMRDLQLMAPETVSEVTDVMLTPRRESSHRRVSSEPPSTGRSRSGAGKTEVSEHMSRIASMQSMNMTPEGRSGRARHAARASAAAKAKAGAM